MKRIQSFTLIEMLAVIIMVGILAGVLIPRVLGIQARARDTVRVTDVRNIAQAIELYSADNDGLYPPAFDYQVDEYIGASYQHGISILEQRGLHSTVYAQDAAIYGTTEML